jgi:hypothetical protein
MIISLLRKKIILKKTELKGKKKFLTKNNNNGI